MNFKKILCAGFFAVFCAYLLYISLHLIPDKECTIPESAVFPFAAQKLDLDKKEFRSLIQAAVDTMYFKGFKYLGDPRDFDHGHLLYSTELPSTPETMPPAVVILYHTQEDAFYYNKKDPGGRFDYLDRLARNWIQWIGSKKVENAKNYLIETGSYNYEGHFTIHEDMLNHKLIGIELSPNYSKQFLFSDVSDKNIPHECRGDKSNLIVIRLPSGDYKTLALLSNKYFWPYYYDYWQKEHP